MQEIAKIFEDINQVTLECFGGWIVLTSNGIEIQNDHGFIVDSKEFYHNLNSFHINEEKFKCKQLSFNFDSYSSEEMMISCICKITLKEFDIYLQNNWDLKEDNPKLYQDRIKWANGILQKYIINYNNH